MNYQVVQPHGLLREYAQSFWILSIEKPGAPSFEFQTFADCSTGIIVQHTHGRSGVSRDGAPIPKAFLYGQSTKPTWSAGSNGLFAAGIVLLPHAAHELFGIEMRELTDQMLPIEDISSSDNLFEIFERPESAIQIMSQYLLRQVQRRRTKTNTIITGCLRLIDEQRGLIPISQLTAHYKVSERQLERAFAQNIGISPRLYSQIRRFHHAVKLLKERPSMSLTDITYDLGFADQSHFNHVVKRFSGMSPRSLQQYLNRNVANAMITKESQPLIHNEIQTYFE